jgi:hypothetical protein
MHDDPAASDGEGRVEPSSVDLGDARPRLRWEKPVLRRIAANDAQVKARAGVEFTRHLTS